MRKDRRKDEMRPIEFTLNYTDIPDGSVLVECGRTKVICTAMIEEKVPFFLKGKNSGWLSCEYSMLPGATPNRKVRDISRGKIDGRTQEIQRLIGRSLRTCIDLNKLGEKTIWIDCDVISADGGTRTASINGAFMALSLAIKKALIEGSLKENPIKNKIAAISVGTVNSQKLLDLKYSEDSSADVDMNIVMDDKLNIVEIQGTAEGETFSRSELNEFLDLAECGIKEIFKIQKEKLSEKSIVLSTNNVNKVIEIEKILSSDSINILSKKDIGLENLDVEENKNTLEENATLKAEAIKEKTKFGVLADDTGLFVNALNLEPGVHSARYSGDHDDAKNREKLLEKLKGKEDRSAYFKTSIIYIDEENKKHVFEGICDGRISEEMKGKRDFGYDCLFIPEGYDKTFGEMSSEEKNKISHRAKALAKLQGFFENIE